MFELAVLEEHIDIDAFAQKFISSPVCHALENADPVYALGKSANELLALILGNEPLNIETGSYASPNIGRAGYFPMRSGTSINPMPRLSPLYLAVNF